MELDVARFALSACMRTASVRCFQDIEVALLVGRARAAGRNA